NTASTRISELCLGRLLGLDQLGLYNRATGINVMLWSNVNYLVGRVLLVEFANLIRRGVPLRSRYLEAVSMMTALLWPALAGLAVLSKPIINLVYGSKWLPASGALVLVSIASMFTVPLTMSWEIFTSK